MPDANKVTTGKPRIAGGIYRAPSGVVLPSSATAKLSNYFKNLGYVSEDGVENENTAESEATVAWGGDRVLETQTEKPDTFKFTLIEATNTDVLKTVYGDENVTGNIDDGIAIVANSQEQEEHAFVIDMALKNNTMKRVVIPRGKVTEVGTVTYNNSDPVGYETTVSCMPDASGNTHYEYIVRVQNVGVTVGAELETAELFGTLVSDMQSGIRVADGAITGTLKYLDTGDLVTTWGAGNFIALKFSGDAFENATSIKVGLDPSQGSGLVEILNDPDRNGAFKVTNNEQMFVVEVTDESGTKRVAYDLTGLVLNEE